MADDYAGIVGAYAYAARRSRSWLLRTYAVASAAFGIFIALLLALAIISWTASPVAFGERSFLGVIGVLLLLPLFTPVLVVARRHRRSGTTAAADRWLALVGFAFMGSIPLMLFVGDPSSHAVGGPIGPVVAWLDRLPDSYGLVPPVITAIAIAIAVWLTRPGE
jgi:hypothetical protein